MSARSPGARSVAAAWTEYLDSGGHDQLRWVDRSSPWGHDTGKSAPPFGWGDIEIGPFVGSASEQAAVESGHVRPLQPDRLR